MVIYKVLWWCPQVDNKFKEYKEKKIELQSIQDHEIYFQNQIQSFAFNDKFWGSQLDILHLSIQHNNKGHHERNTILNNNLLLLLGLWKEVHFIMLHPTRELVWHNIITFTLILHPH